MKDEELRALERAAARDAAATVAQRAAEQRRMADLAQTEADNYARNHAEQAKSKTTKTGE